MELNKLVNFTLNSTGTTSLEKSTQLDSGFMDSKFY